MNWVDITIIVAAALGAITGLKQGLIRMVFTAAGFLVGLNLAGRFSGELADKLSPSGAQWASILSFIIILLAAMVVANLLGGVVRMFVKVLLLGWVDSLGGLVIGVLMGALMVGALLTVVLQWQAVADPLPLVGGTFTGVTEAIKESSLANLIIDKFRLILGLLPDRFDVVTDYFRADDASVELGRRGSTF